VDRPMMTTDHIIAALHEADEHCDEALEQIDERQADIAEREVRHAQCYLRGVLKALDAEPALLSHLLNEIPTKPDEPVQTP